MEPRNWNDAKRMAEQFARIEQEEFDLKPSGMAKKMEAKYNQMFYVGVLYGMALESTKEYPLKHRNPEL